jgi:SulP family sulfate permease
VKELRRTYHLSRMEFWVAMVAFAGVLLLGILKGVLLAAIVSMLLLIRRAAVARVARLGRVAGTDRFADLERTPDAREVPGVLVVRVEAGLLYFNAGHVREEVMRLVRAAGPELRLVVWDLSTSIYADIAGVRMLGEIVAELRERGIATAVAEAHGEVRDLIGKEMGDAVGDPTVRRGVGDVVAAHEHVLTRADPAAPA